jgi:hypothetical protein
VRDLLLLGEYSKAIFPIYTPAKIVELILMPEIQKGHREIPGFSAGENTDSSMRRLRNTA